MLYYYIGKSMEAELSIHRNEFSSYTEAYAAIREFPYCATCPSGVKLHQVQGRFLLLCTRRPIAHNGIRRIEIFKE